MADAVQVVHDSVALMQALATQQGITLHWVAPASPAVVVQADAGGLGRALANLLSNAIKYNRPAGTVSVSVVEQATEVRIEVADTGPGLNASQLAHLFEPFNRLGREGGAIEGTGIGLTLSRRLAEQFGGRIEVHSVPDMGSTFTLVLRRPPPG
ncbi:sensor histidine kinase [Eleftheria terrae]|uniref:sensor histidine kinase n=1 Tax=Eleftheria terrae TaxID=1597781 RepID=UPI00263A4355|nr:sensor histidine kinase [Eleftheria terrae]WKB54014.1 sensor histidine kinase [Eleftheria terrae]